MDTEENLELLKKAQVGWFWTGGEQFIQRGLSMLVSLVLARILGPEVFGLIASVAIFISVELRRGCSGIEAPEGPFEDHRGSPPAHS